MIKKIILFSIFLVQLTAVATDIVIVPLFAKKNWVAGLNLPLQVKGIDLPTSTPVQADIVPGTLTQNDCKVMRDPMLSQNFILRCIKDGTVSLRLSINPVTIENPQAKTTVLNLGPLTISKLEGLKIPDDTGGNEKPDPDWTFGKSLWIASCEGCHADVNSKKGSSADLIWLAINSTIPKMSGLRGLITQEQTTKLEIYLKAP